MKTCPRCFEQNPDDAEQCQICGHQYDSETDWKRTELPTVDIEKFLPGDRIADRYEVVKELGRGGMGIVYLVRDTELRDREVALKMIHPELMKNPEARQRFIDEVIICQELTHANIVKVFHLDRIGEHQFFTMEYIRGRSLRELIKANQLNKPPFNLHEVVLIVDPVLEALSYAHQYTIHRDIKPENIIISGELPEVQIKVLDFGIAKTLSPSRFTYSAQAMGTAYYMAPEQVKGGEIDHRADLFSVGVILYEMLTGDIALGRFRPPGDLIDNLPDEVERIVDKALATRAPDRFQSAEEIRTALRDALPIYESRLVELEQEEARRKNSAQIEDLLDIGQAAFRERRWVQATEMFRQILEIEPENSQAQKLAAEAQDNNDRLKDLEEALQQAESSENYEEALNLAEKLMELSADQRAVEQQKVQLEQQLENQRQEELKRRRAEQKEEARRRDLALIEILLNKAQAVFSDRRWEQTVEFCRQVLVLDPENRQAQELAAEAQDKNDQLEDLEAALQQAESSKNYEEALKLLERLLGLSTDPQLVEKRRIHFKQQLERRLQKEARRKKLAQIENLLNKGHAVFIEHRWEQAAELYRQVLELDPNNHQAKDLAAAAREKNDQLKDLEKAVPQAESSGNFKEALILLKKLLDLSPDQQAVEQRKAYLEQQLEKQHQEELRRRQKEARRKKAQERLEAEKRRKEEEEHIAAKREREKAAKQKQDEEAKRRKEQEALEAEKKRVEQEQREAERRREEEEKRHRQEQARLEAERKQEGERGKIENQARSRRLVRVGIIAAVLLLVQLYILLQIMPTHLYVDTVPENALIRVLNVNKVYKRGMKLDAGRYHLEVSHPGFNTQKKWVTVKSRGDNRFAFKLIPVPKADKVNKKTIPGRLWVDAIPEKSSIRLLNIDQVYKPGMDLESGRYQIKVSHPGFNTILIWVAVEAGKNNQYEFSLKKEVVTGRLSVNVEPAGALVKVKNLNKAYQKGMELELGRYHIEVSHPGCNSILVWVAVEAGENNRYSFNLKKEIITGRLFVDVKPEDTRIRVLNIKPVYERGMELEVGRYHLEVSHAGFKTEKKWVDLKAGEDNRFAFNLSPIPKPPETKSISGPLPGMKFVYIPPGTFMMGSPQGETGRYGDERQHRVTLTDGFYMQTTGVTKGQWKAMMGSNPSIFENCGEDCPVEEVSWSDAQKFIKKLNEKGGVGRYRLPTEAEWEYAARAGSTAALANGGITETVCGYDPKLNEMGWYCGNARKRTHLVAQKTANAWGLYDMHGNVWEWCQDWYDKYPSNSVTDPGGPSLGSYRVVRGGSWRNDARDCRSANRSYHVPGSGSNNLGFRLVRDP